MKKNKNILKYSNDFAKQNNKYALGGKIHKALKIVFYLSAAYTVMMCLSVMMGNVFTMNYYSERTTTEMVAKYNEQLTQLCTMVLCILVTLLCVVLKKLRFAIPVAVLGSINCVVAFTVFYGVSVENDIANGGMAGFWGIFGIPSILLSVFSILLGIMIFIYKRRVMRIYDGITLEIYNAVSENGNKNIDLDEFEKAMDAYSGEEIFRTDIPLKKSVRRRKEKQDKKKEEQLKRQETEEKQDAE